MEVHGLCCQALVRHAHATLSVECHKRCGGSGLTRPPTPVVPVQAPMVSTGSEEPAAIVTKLRQALDAVSRLSSERAAIEEALKVRAPDQGCWQLLLMAHAKCALFLRCPLAGRFLSVTICTSRPGLLSTSACASRLCVTVRICSSQGRKSIL